MTTKKLKGIRIIMTLDQLGPVKKKFFLDVLESKNYEEFEIKSKS